MRKHPDIIIQSKSLLSDHDRKVIKWELTHEDNLPGAAPIIKIGQFFVCPNCSKKVRWGQLRCFHCTLLLGWKHYPKPDKYQL